jgi:hypothetical protein
MCRDGVRDAVGETTADIGRECRMAKAHSERRLTKRRRLAKSIQRGQIHEGGAKFSDGRCVAITGSVTFLNESGHWGGSPRRGDTLQLPFNDPNLDKEATTNGPEAQNEGQDIRKER